MVTCNETTPLPILELGDKSKPGIVFLHGWPDSAAVWATQFYRFCAPPHGQYHCIAPNWFQGATNDPALTEAGPNITRLQLVAEVMPELFNVTGMNAALHPAKDTTMWGNDGGAVMAYTLMAQYPWLTERAVILDIPDVYYSAAFGQIGYQTESFAAYIERDNERARQNYVHLGAPNPKHATWNTLWIYIYTARLHGERIVVRWLLHHDARNV